MSPHIKGHKSRDKPTSSKSKHQSYYHRNKETLKAKARERMAQKRRATKSARSTTDGTLTNAQASVHDITIKDDSRLEDNDYDVHNWSLFTHSLDAPRDDETNQSWIESDPEFNIQVDKRSCPLTPKSGSSEADSADDVNYGGSEFEHVAEIHRRVLAWCSHWGGYHNWSQALDEGYAKALKSGRISEWVHQVTSHATLGRLELQKLEVIEGMLPKQMWKIRELWRQRVELTTMVLRGLNCIELRVDTVVTGPFNVLT